MPMDKPMHKATSPTKNPYLCTPYTILDIQPETDIDWTYTIAFDEPLIGGQFMQLSIPGVGEAPISISDFEPPTASEPGKLHMTIRKVGRLTDAIFNLKPGDSLYMRGPYGNGFRAQALIGKHVTVITGGTGTAPVKNLLKNLFNGGIPTLSTRVVAGFKSPKDVLFKEILADWHAKAQLNPIHDLTITIDKAPESTSLFEPGTKSEGYVPWQHEIGLVTEFIPSLGTVASIGDIRAEDAMAVVVGPPMMMKFTTLALLKAGYLPENIIVSFERNMSCGIGKCGHCKIDETYVCLEGPVFNYTKAARLID